MSNTGAVSDTDRPMTLSTSDNPLKLNVPGWQGFEKIDIWMHEVIGTRVYRSRGWIVEK